MTFAPFRVANLLVGLGVVLLALSASPSPLHAQPLPDRAPASDAPQGTEPSLAPADTIGPESQRGKSLEGRTREELEAQGFEFVSTVEQRRRAHATLLAASAGLILHGVGHWHLKEPSTAYFLAGAELVGLTTIAGGIVLNLRPTGNARLDQFSNELLFLGIATLGSSWFIDVLGTAFHDELGVPSSTRRDHGLGLHLGYEYIRPDNLSMRHVAAAQAYWRRRNYDLDLRVAQELGLGMSDYKLRGVWRPWVAAAAQTSVGVALQSGLVQYRLDLPYERARVALSAVGTINLGRLFPHLDQMTLSAEAGLAVRTFRFAPGSAGASGTEGWRWGGWGVPLKVELGLNLTEELRFLAALERGQGDWILTSNSRIGVPVFHILYRSARRLDLRFFAAFGDGVSAGAGLAFWLGE
ncbi:hypothetical protein EA187_03210 [Lujinxingia sediminis]|uniref:DUF2279 domain-containing protein n=1 Tax=Lujinxingia sediminis TaxID=2480984 RepID=A0ABY0CX27_9DELT|nr:hypothetical protein [Lujinxingia sediminis]RVU48458.1 hypothetical protein EA187_03210 [Lujinxingia sediminis]